MKAGWRARSPAGWWAFAAHRVSGAALAVFLPLHFVVLARAIEGEAALDTFLRWADQPLVKASEWVLVVLLAVHLAGGLRILALELLPWRDWHKSLAAGVVAVALAAGLALALALAG